MNMGLLHYVDKFYNSKLTCENRVNILSLYNKLNFFINTGAQLLDSFYHLKLIYFEISVCVRKISRFCHI